MLTNYVGGDWRRANGVETLDDVDPASGETLAPGAALRRGRGRRGGGGGAGGAARLARDAAAAARPGGAGAARGAAAPARGAGRAGQRRHGQDPRRRRGEVGRGIESVESAAAIPHLLKGETLEGVAAGVDVEMVRQPVGVVAAITPFNFPAMIPLWFLPYAIACGNTFVLKPSEHDPRPAALIFELVDAVEEIPPGVVNLVHGAHDAVNGAARPPGDRRDLLRRPGEDGADGRRARRRRPASACRRWAGPRTR